MLPKIKYKKGGFVTGVVQLPVILIIHSSKKPSMEKLNKFSDLFWWRYFSLQHYITYLHNQHINIIWYKGIACQTPGKYLRNNEIFMTEEKNFLLSLFTDLLLTGTTVMIGYFNLWVMIRIRINVSKQSGCFLITKCN